MKDDFDEAPGTEGIEVDLYGWLSSGRVAIGGETTGMTIDSGLGKGMQVAFKRTLRSRFNRTPVHITGRLVLEQGVESERFVIRNAQLVETMEDPNDFEHNPIATNIAGTIIGPFKATTDTGMLALKTAGGIKISLHSADKLKITDVHGYYRVDEAQLLEIWPDTAQFVHFRFYTNSDPILTRRPAGGGTGGGFCAAEAGMAFHALRENCVAYGDVCEKSSLLRSGYEAMDGGDCSTAEPVRTCTQQTGRLHNPKNGRCRGYSNGCEMQDLRDLGYGEGC